MEIDVTEEGINSIRSEMGSKLLEDSGRLHFNQLYMDLTKTLPCLNPLCNLKII